MNVKTSAKTIKTTKATCRLLSLYLGVENDAAVFYLADFRLSQLSLFLMGPKFNLSFRPIMPFE